MQHTMNLCVCSGLALCICGRYSYVKPVLSLVFNVYCHRHEIRSF